MGAVEGRAGGSEGEQAGAGGVGAAGNWQRSQGLAAGKRLDTDWAVGGRRKWAGTRLAMFCETTLNRAALIGEEGPLFIIKHGEKNRETIN